MPNWACVFVTKSAASSRLTLAWSGSNASGVRPPSIAHKTNPSAICNSSPASTSGSEGNQPMKRHTEHVIVTTAVLVVIAIVLALFGYSGLYNIGADDHHWNLTYRAMQTVRDRSIHVRSDDIKVPNLDDPQLILKGAGQYAAMCTGCHLEPGVENSELRNGMYPQPPNLSKVHVDPQDAFWIIKHGIKMSAMPAWGLDGSHDDLTIWSMR